MSLKERSGKCDLGFSQWHRNLHVFGPEAAAFDIDLVAVCNACQIPLVAYEATQDAGHKATVMLEAAAKRMGCAAVLVVYGVGEDGTLSKLRASECGRGIIGDGAALAAFELAVRDRHHAEQHPTLPTFVYHPLRHDD